MSAGGTGGGGAPTFHRHLALLHPDEAAVAVDATSRRLPWHDVDGPAEGDVAGLAAVASTFGTRAAILGLAGSRRDASGRRHMIVMAEIAPGAPPPDGDRLAWWRPGDEAPEGLPAEHAATLAGGVAAATDDDPRRPAWARRGGTRALFEAVSAAEGDGDAGARAAAPPEAFHQHRSWCLSTVWLHERFVLKASLPLWRSERDVTRLLAEVAPGVVPRVAAGGVLLGPAGPTTPWFLQDRVAGTSPGRSVADLARLASTLGRLQVAAASVHHELLRAGAPVRDAASLRAGLASALTSRELGALDHDERARLHQLGDELAQRLDRLESLAVPMLVCHGDLHPGNALATDGGPVLIDWTDAALAPAGVDLATLVGFGEDAGSAAWRPVVDAYVEAVRPTLGRHAEEVVRAGIDVALAYHAVSYDGIDRALPDDARWQIEGTVAYLVSRMLAPGLPIDA